MPNTLVYELCGMDNDDLLFAATEVGPYVYSFSESQWFLLSGLTRWVTSLQCYPIKIKII